MSKQDQREYWLTVDRLLQQHKFDIEPVTPAACTMLEATRTNLADTIGRCRRSSKPSVQQTRKRLRTALTHAQALLLYTQKRPTHADSVEKRTKKLHDALNGFDIVIWLEVPISRVRSILSRLKAGKTLGADELTRLVRAINDTLSTAGARTGRPMKRSTVVVRAGCVAWLRAGRNPSRSWNDAKSCATGKLAAFLRDLFHACDMRVADTALYSAIGEAIPFITSHPNLRSSLPLGDEPAKIADFSS